MCKLSAGGAPRLVSHFLNVLLLYTTHKHMLCIIVLLNMYNMLSTIKQSHLVAIVDCTYVGSATASLKDLHWRTLSKLFW